MKVRIPCTLQRTLSRRASELFLFIGIGSAGDKIERVPAGIFRPFYRLRGYFCGQQRKELDLATQPTTELHTFRNFNRQERFKTKPKWETLFSTVLNVNLESAGTRDAFQPMTVAANVEGQGRLQDISALIVGKTLSEMNKLHKKCKSTFQ